MKVVCIYGSPRPKGNSAQIADRFCGAAADTGAEVQRFSLNKMNIKGCQGCDACKTRQDSCVLNDDLKVVLDAVRGTDILVIATPVYYSDVPSQLKAFIDRTYSFVDDDYLTNPDASRLTQGKKLVFIQTQEAEEGAYTEIIKKYGTYFQFYGFEKPFCIRACGVGQSDDISEHKDVFRKAEATAKALCVTPSM